MWKFGLISIAIILTFIPSNSAQVPSLGRCRNVNVKTDLQVDPYLGRWYSYEQYPAAFSLFSRCITADYGLNSNGTISVLNGQISPTGRNESVLGYAFVDAPGKLIVRFPESPTDGNYWVLDTDYTNYSVVYSCVEVLLFRLEFVWLLTRNPFPANEIINQAHAVLQNNRVPLTYLNQIDQSCFSAN